MILGDMKQEGTLKHD